MTMHIAATNESPPSRPAGRRLTLALATLATLAILLGSHAPGEAALRWVNDNGPYSAPGSSCSKPQYSTIQAAINAASPGDDVYVCPGVYHENVLIKTKNVSVIATAPAPPATVVKPAVSAPVFKITATGVIVQGFTIVPDGFADQDIGVAVFIDGSALVKILDNAILGGRFGVVLGCTSSRSLVANNTVNGQMEAGINVDTCERRPLLGSGFNKIHNNVACSVASTASIALGGNSNRNQVHDNVATSISVFGKGNNVADNVTQAVIVDQTGDSTLTNNTADPAVCTVTVP